MYTERTPEGDFFLRRTPEIERSKALPWRDWGDPAAAADVEETRQRLTTWLQHTPRKCEPRCTCCRKVDALNAPQAVYLSELYSVGRAVNPFRTGAGKTLAALLAITIAERRAGPQRVVFMCPASGKQKTLLEARDYAKHWRCGAFELVTYEFLANPKNVNWLTERAPTLVIADEAHKITPGSKVAKRLVACAKAMLSAGKPFSFLPFTASLSSRALKECWHYVRLAMGDKCPLPTTRVEMEAWALATDEKVPVEAQILPGALLALAPPQEGDTARHRAQLALGARLAATPGFVSTRENVPPVTLKLSTTQLELPAGLQAIVAKLRKDWELPSGETFDHAWTVWQHSRRLGCGVYFRPDPTPPRAWLEARKALNKFVKDYLQYHHDIDSPVHVINRIDRGELKSGEAVLAAWREIEPHYTWNSVPEWVDTTVLEYSRRWLASHERGICWVESRPLGRRLAAETGLQYFAEGAKDARTGVELAKVTGAPIIVSSKHTEMFNLQHYYCDNLVTSCEPVGKKENQRIGRTWRQGQDSPEVTVEYLITTLETETCLAQCFADSKREQAFSCQPQALCYGELTDDLIAGLRN